MINDTLYTIVTGGSHGLGRAMAEECARRNMPLLIVALPDDNLEKTAMEFSEKYSIPVQTLGLDLSQPESTDQLLEWVKKNNFQVKNLINNAGFGRSGLLEHISLKELRTMVRLNCENTMALTYGFLPSIRLHKGRILNMSSMEGVMYMPYKSVYAATKHFIQAFSLSLREELRPYGVSVMALCPGPTLTNEDGLKRIEAMGLGAKLLVRLPEQSAPGAIRAWLNDKAVYIPGALPLIIVKLLYFFPRGLRLRLLEKMFRQYKEEKPLPAWREEVGYVKDR